MFLQAIREQPSARVVNAIEASLSNTSKSGLFYSREYSPFLVNNPTIYMVFQWKAWKYNNVVCSILSVLDVCTEIEVSCSSVATQSVTFLFVFDLQMITEEMVFFIYLIVQSIPLLDWWFLIVTFCVTLLRLTPLLRMPLKNCKAFP